MDERTETSPCKECEQDGEQLLAEVDHLRQHLAERDAHIVNLETEYHTASSRATSLEEQVHTWREKYERLYDSHMRVQKLNQILEDKLLGMADRLKGEKGQLTRDVASLSVRLAETRHNYGMLQKENERYKNDMNLAIQLLQCKPDNFVSQKLDNLPVDTQARVSQYVMSKTPKSGSNHSKNGNEVDNFDTSEYEFNISASLMTKILEDSIQDSVTKHCDTCTCSKNQSKPFCYNESFYTVSTQTVVSGDVKTPCNCHADAKSIHSISNVSLRSVSPQATLVTDKTPTTPLYIAEEPINVPETVKNFEIPKERARKSSLNMEPAVHHKLCDRTKSVSSQRSCISNNEEVKDVAEVRKIENDTISLRKNSHSSTGALSRTSSVAKSTVSTHKSNTQVGPGPRFCHLRMQAGSKNILLDNAEPDVPPVLYRRQSKCKDLNDVLDNFIDLEDKDVDGNEDGKRVVVESTLIDVHVDSSVKGANEVPDAPINPVLMNVSSSPLQPQKTHNFSSLGTSKTQTVDSQPSTSEVDNLLNDFTTNVVNNETKEEEKKPEDKTPEVDNVKIFNFDRYEQNKLTSQISRPLRKIDMSQLHSIESTKISKDLPPQNLPKLEKVVETKPLPTIVNVYPNLTQTHLKVNEKRVFTNEQSTSSLSSDDSAALLQKQQLLRVAEWVEQNLEQNNYNDPLEEDLAFARLRRDSKLNRLADTLNELALNMPHPVSKYSKPFKEPGHLDTVTKTHKKEKTNVAKETLFPVEYGNATVTEINSNVVYEDVKARDMLNGNHEKMISAEDYARMEYNVKKFLLSGPQWAPPASRSRRTSSKTETDV